MTLKEKISAIKTENLGDLAEILDDVDKMTAELESANALVVEKDKKISELQEQTNKLYGQLLLNTTGTSPEDEEEKEETLDEYNERIKKQIME